MGGFRVLLKCDILMRTCVTFLILFLISTAYCQVSSTPTDSFYTDATRWYLLRYTKSLPLLKPYRVATVKRILLDVIDSGDEVERKRALYYQDRYFGTRHGVHAGAAFNTDIRVKKVDDGGDDNTKTYEHDDLYNGSLTVAFDYQLNNFLGLSADLGFLVRNNDVTTGDVLPVFITNTPYELSLPMTADGGDASFLLDPSVVFTWGDERLFGTVGINRTSYGLFFDDSIILNGSAPPSINATFNYNGRVFSYSQLFGIIAAKKYSSDSYRFDKFMGFHTTEFHLPSRWSISLYESVVTHKPFNPSYLLPVPWFIVSNLSGFDDNVMSGISFSWKPGCVALTLDLLLDDFKPTKLLKLKINDAALRAAFKAGFVYSPPASPCEYISVSYTLVTPYTYTRYNNEKSKYDFLGYTNFGNSMGSPLPPNSDSIGMTIAWRMFDYFRLKVSTSFSRHGNPYEDLDDDDVIKMSQRYYNAHGLIDSDTRGVSSATDYTGFLKQHDIMYIMQASLYAEWEQRFRHKKTNAGSLTISAQYTFEYINKDGVDTPIYRGTYDSSDTVKAARDGWQAALHDSYNHYFTVGVKYFY